MYPDWLSFEENCFNSKFLGKCDGVNVPTSTISSSTNSSSTSSTPTLSSFPASKTLSNPRTSSTVTKNPIQFKLTVLPSTTQKARLSTSAIQISPSSSTAQRRPPKTSVAPTPQDTSSSDQVLHQNLPIIVGVGAGALVFFATASFVVGAFIGRRPQKKEPATDADSSDTLPTTPAIDQAPPRAGTPLKAATEERTPHANGNGHLFMTHFTLPTSDRIEDLDQKDDRSESKNSDDKKPREPNILKENEMSSPGLESDDGEDLSLPPLTRK
ncbi:hypothetical protein HDU97_007022 [Phlyctochytrium planicorne]|nr:hypothetical protein HDU97_007022 [Phlyctochytrium planicorne]